jgi:hypothetical protein
VIKFFLVFTLTFYCTKAFPQSHSDTTLKNESVKILERNISFEWNGGSLPGLLKKLSAEENLNFAYSREKTNHIIINKQVFNSEKLSSLLDAIFRYTGYNYVIIGKTIAIVEDKKNVLSEKPAIKNSESTASTSSVPENTQKNISHIYPDAPVASRLPFHLRIKLWKIYRNEVRLARKHENDTTGQNISSDTIRKKTSRSESHYNQEIFLSANAGAAFFLLRHASEFSDWKEQLDFNSETRASVTAGASGGIKFSRFILEGAIRYNRIKIENSYTEDPKIMRVARFPEVYTVVTVPVNILYYRKYNKIIAAAGPGIGISIIKREGPKDRMRPYYDRIKGTIKEKYTESNRSITPSFDLKVFAGYSLTERWYVSGNIFISIPLRAYHTNSVYRFYPYTAGLQTGISYFFSGR